MTYLSIIEKFKILLNSLLDFKFILVFAVLLPIVTFFYGIKKISTKKYVLFMIISFIIVFGISIISNHKVLSNTFDNFTTILFGNIYFPSIYVYIGVLVLSFIAFIISMLNVMLKKIYKVINSIMFVVNNILFVTILNIIAKNKIDIFRVDSLYTNTELVAILELSMELCILWILSLIATYTTNVICERLAYKKIRNIETEDKEIFNPVLEVNVDLDNSSEDFVNNNYPILIDQIDNVNEGDIVIETISDAEEKMTLENAIDENNINQEDVIIETISDVKEEMIIEDVIEENIISEIENNKENNILTFNDILNGCIPVNYYNNNIANAEYILYDPQKMYEDKYNKIKSESIVSNEISLNDLIEEEEISTLNDIISSTEEIKEDILSVEALTIKEKEKASEERLQINTVSLNDLIEEEEININEIKDTKDNNINILEIEIDSNVESEYTIDDYKKMVEMLNAIKSHSISSSINIDDAVAISLINNYSIDECLKFKNILENSLN